MTDYADTYDPDTDFDRHYTIATGHAIGEHVKPGEIVLELGCATGLMTEILAARGCQIIGVDRSEEYLGRARERVSRAEYVRDDVSTYEPGVKIDHVVATNVLHELPDPLGFLRHCRRILRPGGLLHLALQNPNSIHRLVALELGLIDSVTEISERGAQWGTLHMFTAAQLEAMCYGAGFEMMSRRGIMLKPLPNAEMERLSPEVLDGFQRAARWFPEHSAVNYLVARA